MEYMESKMQDLLEGSIATAANDEREDKPSASGIGRVLACPGSRNMSRGLVTPSKPWTESGTLGHAVLSGDLDEDEVETDILVATQRAEETLGKMIDQLGFDGVDPIVERRLWFHDDHGNPVASGKPDRIYIKDGHFFIPDFKLGHKDQIEPALNPQLVMYGLLVQEEFDIHDGYVAIIPAWRKTPAPAWISAETLRLWRESILLAIEAAEKPTAPRIAGDHCDYCPARPICREAWALVEKAATFSPGTELSAEEQLNRYDVAKHAEATIKTYLEHLKTKLTAEPFAVPGLQLKAGKRLIDLNGSAALYERLKGRFTLDDVLSCSDISLNKLTTVAIGGEEGRRQLVAQRKLSPTLKAAKKELIKIIGELATEIQTGPSLERIK